MNTEILIVEDEGLIALDLKKKLEQAGYTVPAIADNADDALLSVKSLRPSLVLMDIRLRGVQDGVDTAEQIRRRFHVPVIFVTAHADRETLDRARITEPFGYIVKPFHSVDFRAQIEMAIWKHTMEQKLRVSEAWLYMTFQNVADAMIATDSEGKIAFMNAPAAQLTGWDMAEAKGQPLLDVFEVFEETTGLPVVQPLAYINNAIGDAANCGIYDDRAPGAERRAFKLIRRDGSDPLIIEAELSANTDEGKIFGVIVVFRDVTEGRMAERHNRQLQKMGALALMATGLGRELAESQARIDASLKHLIERSEGTTMRLLWDVYELCAHQQSVVQQLITLGRADAGHADLVDLNETLIGMEDKIKKVLGSHRPLNLKLQPGALMIQTDRRYLEDNLLRLVADTRQATPDGGAVDIATMTVRSPEGRCRARVAIHDTRKVFRHGAKERAFEPYYQSVPGKRNPGFSLALVYQFVALNGGSIEVESTPGEGSAYLVTFPVADNSPVQRDKRTSDEKMDGERVAVTV